MRSILAAAMFAAMIGAATPGTAMPREAWTAFLEGSYSPYRADDEAPGWEDILFIEAGRARDADDAVTAFGQAIGVSPDRARVYADAIVGSVVARETCGRGAECAPWEGYGYEAMFAAARSDPGGDLFIVLGQNLASSSGPFGTGRFIGETVDHPARLRIVRQLYEYAGSEVALAALVVDTPDDPLVVQAVLSAPAAVDGESDKWDGWMLAVLESGAARLEQAGAPPDVRAVYAQAVLARYLNLGLSAEGVALFRALPDSVRELLPLAAPCDPQPDRPTCEGGAGEDLADELAAALWLAGDQDGARAWIAQAEARLATGEWSTAGRHLALLDALAPTRPARSVPPVRRHHACSRRARRGRRLGLRTIRAGDPADRRRSAAQRGLRPDRGRPDRPAAICSL